MIQANISSMYKRYFSIRLLLLAVAIPQAATAQEGYQLETIVSDLNFPWSISFLPNGDRLFTELGGNLRRLSADNTVGEPISGVPEVFRAGQGGLFDALPAPDFESSNLVYLSYSQGSPDSNATTVARGRLKGNRLLDVEVIFSTSPKKYAPLHYGGRIAWMSDGTLLLTIGDGFDFREKAQDLSTNLGKSVRMNPDGTPAEGNPFPQHPYVWTYGHRNPQGLVVSSAGQVYLHEHGPQGGDEVNLLQPGNNYGWPVITHGMDYNGAYVTPFTEHKGMQQPQHVWVPSIAPSGFMLYEGDLFPEWQGDLFIGALVDEEVRRLDMVDGAVSNESTLFAELGARIRDIRQDPDGSIWVITDGEHGSIVRVRPN